MQDTEAAAQPTALLWLLYIRCCLTALHFSTLQSSGGQGRLMLIYIVTKIITQCERFEGRLLLFLAKCNPMFEWLFVLVQTAEWFLTNGYSHQGPFFSKIVVVALKFLNDDAKCLWIRSSRKLIRCSSHSNWLLLQSFYSMTTLHFTIVLESSGCSTSIHDRQVKLVISNGHEQISLKPMY